MRTFPFDCIKEIPSGPNKEGLNFLFVMFLFLFFFSPFEGGMWKKTIVCLTSEL